MLVKPVARVASDFDRIAAALADTPPRERLTAAERALVRQVPAGAKRAVDVGCGDGVITRALAMRGMNVLGVDVSRGMIDLARERTPPSLRAEYRLLDIMAGDLPIGMFDTVVSVAMVHHVALESIIPRLVSLVAPGGTLLIQDVVARGGLRHFPIDAAAWAVRQMRWIVGGSRIQSGVATAYRAHGADEDYLDARVVRDVYRPLLPDARVHDHLEWRYTVVWQRPHHA
jgi:2-polyprenyl-3-methyl-5-hydroxy-6-metoxy-1,4-benzoquinol methylase